MDGRRVGHGIRPENALTQEIPIERLEVSDIKDDAVTLRNRPIVQRLGSHDTEKRIAPPAGVRQPFQQFVRSFGGPPAQGRWWESQFADKPTPTCLRGYFRCG